MPEPYRLKEPSLPRPDSSVELEAAIEEALLMSDRIPETGLSPVEFTACLVKKGHRFAVAQWAIYDLSEMGGLRVQTLDSPGPGSSAAAHFLRAMGISPPKLCEWNEVRVLPAAEGARQVEASLNPDDRPRPGGSPGSPYARHAEPTEVVASEEQLKTAVPPQSAEDRPRRVVRTTKYQKVREMLDEEGEPNPEDRADFVRRYNERWANKGNSSTPGEKWCKIDVKTLGGIIRNRRKSVT